MLVLLEDLLNTNRAQLLAHPERKVTLEQQKVLNLQIERRKNHEPLAYIRGKTEFYGREFIINNHVLEPRPESETMISMLKKLYSAPNVKGPSFHVVDVGTGSGALAITTKLEFPEAKVIATDIDKKCLAVARQNAKKHNAPIAFAYGDLMRSVFHTQNSSGRTEFEYVVLANLPYVPDNFHINLAAGHEPRRAIFGGSDGLDLYRRLFAQIDSLNDKPTYILTESLPTQHKELAKIAKENGYKLQKTEDFIQQFSFRE